MGLKIIGGRYKIISRLAGGGFGMTFLAEDEHLPSNHPCVVKQLKPQATDPKTLEISRRLFDTEAKVLHKLGTHPQIPQLFAFFEENKEFYLVQEYIHGHPLSEELKLGQRFSEEETISLLTEVLEILEFVHQQNVIHRDVNPRNIIRKETNGKLFLIDFGAVKEVTTQMIMATPGQTALSVIIGTPGYMPSEQANGHPKLSSDVYSVGMIGIQSLTGLPPENLSKDSETAEIIWQHKVSVSRELAEILNTMLRYDFRERYSSAGEALTAMRRLSNSGGFLSFAKPETLLGKQPKKRKLVFWLKGLVFLLLLVGGGGGLYAAKFLFASQTAIEYYQEGITLAELSRYEEALKLYKKATNIQQDYVEAWNQQGGVLYELERYEAALSAYDRSIQINPDSPEQMLKSWIGRGLVLNKLERFDEALTSFDRAVKIEPKSHQAWQGQGDILFHLQRYEEAIEAYRKTLKIKDDSYDAWYNLAQSYHQIGEYKEAGKAYEKAVELKPDQAIAWYNLGNIFLEHLEKYEDAVEAYDKAVRFDPDYAAAWYSRGNALVKWEKPEAAVDSYEKALSLKSSEDPELLSSLGWALHELRRYSEAIEIYDRVLYLQPQNYQVLYNRGNALYQLERYSEAIVDYERAIAIKQDHYESWYSRGNVLMKLQRYEQAIESYEKALLYEPDYDAAKDAKKDAEKELERLFDRQPDSE